MRVCFVIAFSLLAAPGWACPAAPDHSNALAALFNQVRAAKTEAEGQEISNQMWALWTQAPDEAAQELLDSGMRKRGVYDFLGAVGDFDRLVRYCPDYAEGYNQRAFVRFLRQEYELALADLDQALRLSPTHVGALSGKALTLMGLGRVDAGQSVLQDALQLNPWLPERHLLRRPKEKEL
ncbi:MAG: tetratricopeptide repeat protein [Thalassovita sp.]